jgi:predicted nucleic acid-binding protein
MTGTVVLDASALVKRILAERDSQVFRAWFTRNEESRFVAPTLIFYETGLVLEKNMPKADPSELRTLHSRLLAGIALVPPEESSWESTDGLTFYEAQYLDLAARLRAPLVTADDRMRAVAAKKGVSVPKI